MKTELEEAKALIEKLSADKRDMFREIYRLCQELKEAQTDRDFARALLPKEANELVALMVKADLGGAQP